MSCYSCSRLVVLLCFVSSAVIPSRACEESANESAEGIPKNAQRVSELAIEQAEAWTVDALLFLKVEAPVDQKTVTMPRLGNSVRRVYWQTAQGTALNLKPEPSVWLVDLQPRPAVYPSVLVLELDGPLRLFSESLQASADPDGTIQLPASMAITRGSNLRFEPQPHKNTVGYWSNAADTAEWKFRTDRAGSYEVDILQGCGKGHGGSTVNLVVGQTTLPLTVNETGHFQNFVWQTVGRAELPAGAQALQLIPVRKVAGAVMDVRRIRLVPAGTKRPFEPELADPAALPR